MEPLLRQPLPAAIAPPVPRVADAAPSQPPQHLAFLDGIRGLAALYVVLHHVWLTAYPHTAGSAGCGICIDAPAWTHWLRWGQLAVVVFIVVSGYSLALGPLRHGDRLPHGFGDYIARRAWRIVPPFWAALALSCVVVAFVTGPHTGNHVTAKTVAVHGLLLHNLIDSTKPNGAFWSIAVEWQIYFVFPLLLWLCRRSRPWAMAAMTAAACMAAYLLGTQHGWLALQLGLAPDGLALLRKLVHLSPQFLALFAFGVLAAHVSAASSARAAARWIGAAAALAGAMTLLLARLPPATIEARYFWIDLGVGAATAAAIAGLAGMPSHRAAQLLAAPLLRWLGASSYSLYLVHMPVIETIDVLLLRPQALAGTTHFVALTLLALPAALLASRLFWRWCERPFMQHRSAAGWRAVLARPRRVFAWLH